MGEFEEYIRKELQKDLDARLNAFREDFDRHWIKGESGGGCREECMFCKDELDEKILKRFFIVMPKTEENGPRSNRD